MSEIKSVYNGLVTDLTRTVDQLERAISGDITIQVGGAVIESRVTDAIAKRGLKNQIVAGLAGAGFAYATVVLEILPLVALEAIQNKESPDEYVATFSALSERLRAAAETYKAGLTGPSVADLKGAVEQSPIFYADNLGAGPSLGDALEHMLADEETGEGFDENRVLNILAGLGMKDVQGLVEVSPGVYTGTAVISGDDAEALFEGAEGSSFNTEAPRQPDETWAGPSSRYPRHVA